jgi:nucleoside-diphosphate-sugar epimerase
MRILVTGGAGFLGAWIIRRLAAEGHALRVFDTTGKRGLVAEIAGSEVAQGCEWRTGDIVSRTAVREAAAGCDAIIHLAGILTPDCRTDPIRGAEINLIGTLNVFEAALAHGIRRVVYTSSAGVYGPQDTGLPVPTTHYGAFKLACEGSARAYWSDRGLASIGFRPYVVYGPGRETGMTAAPTLACKAAASSEPYIFGYSGTAGLVYVDDVAAAYVAALEREPDGAHVFNLIGTVASAEEVIAEIRRQEPEADIRPGGPPAPFAQGLEETGLRETFPGLPSTSLSDGIAATLAFYRNGRLPAL